MMKTTSLRKWGVLCKKDIIDFFKNPAIYISVLMPIFFVLFYRFMRLPGRPGSAAELAEDRARFQLVLGAIMNCSMCGLMVASTSIAEEKEKFTLRTLMLSNVTGLEFLLSKLTVGFLMTVAGNVVVFFLAGAKLGLLPAYLTASALGAVSMNLVSAVVGLLSRDQMSCGVIQVPFLLLFMIPPVFSGSVFSVPAIGSAIETAARFTPLNAMIQVFFRWGTGKGTGELPFHFAVLIGWIAAGALVFVLVYRKKRLDN